MIPAIKEITDEVQELYVSLLSNTFAIAILLQLGLLQVRMTLHLVDSWHNLGSLQEVLCLGDGEVRETNRFNKPVIIQFFHSLQQ